MEVDRAKELIGRRRDLERKISALLDEYRDVILPSGHEARGWWQAHNDHTTSVEAREAADFHLAGVNEALWDSFVVRAWSIGAELGPIMIEDMPTAFGTAAPAEQSPLLTRAIHQRALGG